MSAAQFGTLVCIGKRILTIAAYFQQIEFQTTSADFSRSIEAKCVELVLQGFLQMLCQSQLIWIMEDSRRTEDLKYVELYKKFRSDAVANLKPYNTRYRRRSVRSVLLEMLKQHLKSMRRLLKKWTWSHTTSRLCSTFLWISENWRFKLRPCWCNTNFIESMIYIRSELMQ